MLVFELIEISSLFDLDAPALWVLSLVETWQYFFLRRKATLKDYFLMAFRSVVFVGLPMLPCKKLRVLLIFTFGKIALICYVTCGTACGLFSSCRNLHRLVAGSL